MSGIFKDLTCPYCNADNYEPDDCTEQETVYEVKCEMCKKVFGFTFTFSKDYTELKLPCSNGKKHKWIKTVGVPKEFFQDKYRCSYCD